MKKSSMFFLPFMLILSCNGFRSGKAVFRDVAPHERYVESLEKANLAQTAMAREWTAAGEGVFDDSVFVEVPFAESGFFEAGSSQARSYALLLLCPPRFADGDGWHAGSPRTCARPCRKHGEREVHAVTPSFRYLSDGQ